MELLDRALQQVLPALASIELPQAAPSSSGQLDLAQAKPLIGELEALLRENNFEATDTFAKLQQACGEGPWTESMNHLQTALDAFRFNEAQQHLAAVHQSLTESQNP